jgi:hypothetical protein
MLHQGERACITYVPDAPIGVSMRYPGVRALGRTGRVDRRGYLVDG